MSSVKKFRCDKCQREAENAWRIRGYGPVGIAGTQAGLAWDWCEECLRTCVQGTQAQSFAPKPFDQRQGAK